MSPNSQEPKQHGSLATRRADRRNAIDPRSDERWNDILVGAATVFCRVGYSAASLEDIAEEVGLNRASLYYYVGTKAELLIEVLRRPIFDMTAKLIRIAESDGTADEKLRRVIAAHMNAMDTAYPELFVFLAEHLHLLTIGDPEGDVVVNARRYGEIITGLIKEGQEAGYFRGNVHPRIAMMGIVGMCNWTHRWYREQGEMTLSEIGEDFTTLALEGLILSRGRNSRR